MAEELLSPLVDFLFKRIFGDPDNTEILIAFLNGVFEDAGDPLVESVELLNPFIDKDALTDKMSVLDIRAKTQADTLIDIEIQIRNAGNMRARSLYYWAKLYEGQIHEGDPYHMLNPAIAINVLNFVELANDRVHNVFHVRNADGEVLTDHLALHFLELPKMHQNLTPSSQHLMRWLLFLITRTKPGLEELVKEDHIMEKALNVLEFLSQDEKTRMLYEARQKGLHDYVSAIASAEEKGEKRGREEGREEGIRDVAQRMLRKGVPIPDIADVTGLSEAEIKALPPPQCP